MNFRWRPATKFWGNRKERTSSSEKFKILSVTGGIPRYLEEINPAETPEQNIKRLCFNPAGILFNDFGQIFEDIFKRRAPTYKKVVKALVNGRRSFTEICAAIKVDPNGAISDYLSDLEQSGFLAQDSVFSLATGKQGKLSQYRIRDNYLRFYLKYILPQKKKIQQEVYKFGELDRLPNYDTIMGFQLENLVLNHMPYLLQTLEISPEKVISASPYFQRKTKRQRACQIDLLIHTPRTIYICEIKFRQQIDGNIIDEVEEKVRKIYAPRTVKALSWKTVLIYVGELNPQVVAEDYFDKILPLDNLLG